MDDKTWKRAARPLPRRGFLRLTGLSLGAAALLQACGSDDKKDTGKSETSPATGGQAAAPKKLSGDLKILLWSHFVPAFDTWFDKFAQDWGNTNGVKVRVDHIPHLQLPSRHAAEIAAQAGHDIMQFTGSGGGAHLYFKHLEDLDDLCERLAKDKGGWADFAKNLSFTEGHWKTFPDFFIRFPMLYREDLWGEVGYNKGPDTWDDILEGGRKLKAKGFPGGIGYANHVDSDVSTHAILYSFGAKIVDADGKTVILDSKETRDALKFGKALFDEAMPAEVLAWDDSSNNTLLAGGKGSWIHNPISASLTIKNDKNLDLYNKIGIANTPKGPAMRRTAVPPNSFGIWKFASNKEAARAFLSYYADNWMEGYKTSVSYDEPFLKGWAQEGFSKFVPSIDDPKLKQLTDFTEFAALPGWPGPMTAAYEEVWQTYTIPQMFAKVAKGTSVDDAVKDTVAAIKQIYQKHTS